MLGMSYLKQLPCHLKGAGVPAHCCIFVCLFVLMGTETVHVCKAVGWPPFLLLSLLQLRGTRSHLLSILLPMNKLSLTLTWCYIPHYVVTHLVIILEIASAV